jgi:hypothetical protein
MQMVKKIGHIILGWGKRLGLISVSKAEEKLADLRLQVCGKCTYAEKSRALRILNGSAEYENQLKCSLCSCPCYEKTIVVDEECPISKW